MIKYVVLILFLVLKFFTLENCFFWDNTAGYSMPASYLLENGFLSFVYPAQYVAEPPLAHLYLALLWSLFGKSLLVAHLSITVFSLGVIWQVYRLCERLETKYTPYIYETKASIVLVNKDFTPEQEVKATLIKVDNAYESLAKLLNLYEMSKNGLEIWNYKNKR